MCWDHPFDYSKIMVPNFNSLKGGSGISDRESTGPTEIPAGECFWDKSAEAFATIFRKLSSNPSIWPYAQFNVTGSTPTWRSDHWKVSNQSCTQQVSPANRAWHALIKWFQLSVYFISTSHSLTCPGPPQVLTIAPQLHLHGWEGGTHLGWLLNWNRGGISITWSLGERLRATYRVAWGGGNQGRARMNTVIQSWICQCLNAQTGKISHLFAVWS